MVLAILDSENSCCYILAKIFATTPLGNKKKKKNDSAICAETFWNKFYKAVVCPLHSL